ncbi:MAG: type II toxin-antitoxin system RelE/ParE family toxin [Asticcacaulis sp.]|uniref:type II toxin-antitoxin system RelE/ParE family toxin n=1 Tax=Asticcacaulis sp. TaxID=1872648 RepID=UPI003F7B5B96
MKLVFSRLAEDDLEQIADYISIDNPDRAFSYINEIEAHCETLLMAPQSGTRRDDLAHGLRSVPHGAYIIFYRTAFEDLRIERVLHSARHFPAIFDDQ